MKPLLKLTILKLFVFFAGFSHTQTDTLSNQQQDSVSYLVPEVVNPGLDLIVPPKSFVVSEAFNGYISYENSSAIIMTEIRNSNYLKIAEGMNEEFYKANNLNYISKEKFVSENGVQGVMFKLWFELKGDRYIRYMVYAGDLEKTLWLNITYPHMLEELIELEILKSIKTIKLNN